MGRQHRGLNLLPTPTPPGDATWLGIVAAPSLGADCPCRPTKSPCFPASPCWSSQKPPALPGYTALTPPRAAPGPAPGYPPHSGRWLAEHPASPPSRQLGAVLAEPRPLTPTQGLHAPRTRCTPLRCSLDAHALRRHRPPASPDNRLRASPSAWAATSSPVAPFAGFGRNRLDVSAARRHGGASCSLRFALHGARLQTGAATLAASGRSPDRPCARRLRPLRWRSLPLSYRAGPDAARRRRRLRRLQTEGRLAPPVRASHCTRQKPASRVAGRSRSATASASGLA